MFDGAADMNSLWVAGVYNETVQLVTAPSITSIEDLKGKTVCVGDVGSGTALNAAQVLEAYGMTFDDIKVMYDSFSGGAEASRTASAKRPSPFPAPHPRSDRPRHRLQLQYALPQR